MNRKSLCIQRFKSAFVIKVCIELVRRCLESSRTHHISVKRLIPPENNARERITATTEGFTQDRESFFYSVGVPTSGKSTRSCSLTLNIQSSIVIRATLSPPAMAFSRARSRASKSSCFGVVTTYTRCKEKTRIFPVWNTEVD